jgi:ubiquinone/menaquinone biosynthesis C-methylase UbiE
MSGGKLTRTRKPKILCTDSSEPMVAAVKQEIASQPWPNTTVRVADSQAFDLPDNEFDYVITSFAIMASAARTLAPAFAHT